MNFVSQERIATRLAMRSAANVSQQLRRFDRSGVIAKLPKKLQAFLREGWKA